MLVNTSDTIGHDDEWDIGIAFHQTFRAKLVPTLNGNVRLYTQTDTFKSKS